MNYVNKNLVINCLEDLSNENLIGNENDTFISLAEAKDRIEELPAADVVEVVRCKECDVPHNKWLGCPNLNGMIPPPEFYCAKGRRRERREVKENE